MSEREAGAFNPKVVFGLLLFGALAFFAMLYFIGTGQTGGNDNNSDSHAASYGLNGYAGLVQLLEEDGTDVSVSRNQAELTEYNLLVITPPKYADPEDIAKVIADRRYSGPTIVILPKWDVAPASFFTSQDVEEGWVELTGASEPNWAEDLDEAQRDASGPYSLPIDIEVEVGKRLPVWRGMGMDGELPDGKSVQEITDGNLIGLINGGSGKMLVGYLDDSGNYPAYEEAAGYGQSSYEDDEYRDSQYGVIIVAEPDLMNNYGMATRNRAALARKIIRTAMDGDDLPVVFDVTLNGLGGTQNLLTLAFTPPFLAATLCLIIAMFVVAWRSFRRFGPAVDEGRAIAYGKERLVRNSAGFIQRTRRLHLLSGPYASMMRERIAGALALRRPDDDAIDNALARRLPDEPQSLSHRLATLRNARTRADIIRAADALKSIERKLER
ncbi:MAG: DUF4350 domain-containing protein [Altererythrobacter sp.]